jgi:hypothetical protein
VGVGGGGVWGRVYRGQGARQGVCGDSYAGQELLGTRSVSGCISEECACGKAMQWHRPATASTRHTGVCFPTFQGSQHGSQSHVWPCPPDLQAHDVPHEPGSRRARRQMGL